VLSLFWTELVGDDKVQIIVPNGGVWGQALRNYSVYPTPARAGELRFRVPEGINFEHATEIVGAAVEAEARLLTDPGPKVLLDHAADNAIEIIVTFATEDDAALVRSDLIRAVHGAFEADDAPSRQDGRGQPATPPPRTFAARWA
jgi:small conductance mechanosensitive channel